MKILCVDDSQICCMVLIKQLQLLGFDEAESVADAFSAMQLLERNEGIELVIADQHLGKDSSGLDLLTWVRQNPLPRVSSLPFLIVTGDSNPELILQSAMLEVDGFLIKPLTLDALESQLNRVFRHRPQSVNV
ncbi:MAG TPA: response regulator [Fibrobacteraceae bacterium]|nr:response regulator [Fibrobacteraceae bacterium]